MLLLLLGVLGYLVIVLVAHLALHHFGFITVVNLPTQILVIVVLLLVGILRVEILGQLLEVLLGVDQVVLGGVFLVGGQLVGVLDLEVTLTRGLRH